jgi:hypothetical protein
MAGPRRRTLGRLLALLLFFSLGGMACARAADRLEASLYLGQNAPLPLLSHAAPDDLADRLQQVFGFAHYQLLKSGRIDLDHTWAQWFVPRKDFFIRLTPQVAQPDEPQLVDYQIYQDGFIVATGKYEPRDDTPLFINGPDFKKGRLIFVLETRD